MEDKTKQTAAQKLAEERQKKLETLRLAINSASSNPNLMFVLKHLMEIGGIRLNPVVFNRQSGVMDKLSTEYNCGRLSICQDLLRQMSPEVEIQVLKREK